MNFDGDTNADTATLPSSGSDTATASAYANVPFVIDNTCLGSGHTTASADATVQLSAPTFYGEYSRNSASAFQIGNSYFPGLYAVENAHSGADFSLHGTTGSAGILTVAAHLVHDLEIRFCPSVTAPRPSINTVHIVQTTLRITGGGAPLVSRRGVGFVSTRSDFDPINGPFPAAGKGLGDFADLNTWSGTSNAFHSDNVNETFTLGAGVVVDAVASVRSKTYTENDHAEIADLDDSGTLNPILDRDAFAIGAAYPSDSYSPFVDFDQDGDNDLADYVTFDSLSELNVGCRVDYDQDSYVGNNDEAIFVNNWFNGLPSADIGSQGGVHAPDGQFDNNDFAVFYDYFFASPCVP